MRLDRSIVNPPRIGVATVPKSASKTAAETVGLPQVSIVTTSVGQAIADPKAVTGTVRRHFEPEELPNGFKDQ